MIDGQVYTEEVVPVTENPKTLGEVVQEAYDKFGPADETYYLKMDKVNKKGRTEFEELKYLKGPKKKKEYQRRQVINISTLREEWLSLMI